MIRSLFDRITQIFFDAPGMGGGAGGGAGAGAGSSGSGAGAGAGAAATPIVLSADSLVDFGDGKPVKWGDASNADTGRYVTRDRFDAGVKYLQSEAQKLQASWDKYHEGIGQRPNRPEPAAQGEDPLAGIRDMPIVDGRSLERLYTTLQQKGLGPIAQVVAQMATRLKQLEGNVGTLHKGYGSIAERDQAQDFEGYITKSFADVGALKGLPDGLSIDSNDPHLREKAKDLYLSHEVDSWKPGEFTKALKARLEADIAFVRALDKKAVENAQQKKRVWMNPNRGSVTPGGKPQFKFQRGAEIAKQFFGDAAPQGT